MINQSTNTSSHFVLKDASETPGLANLIKVKQSLRLPITSCSEASAALGAGKAAV
jgi:hypothetical protein